MLDIPSLFSLQGRIAVTTAGARGIGRQHRHARLSSLRDLRFGCRHGRALPLNLLDDLMGSCDDGPASNDHVRALKDIVMAKGQQKSNKEARKPKQEKPKTIAAAPSTKGTTMLGEHKKTQK